MNDLSNQKIKDTYGQIVQFISGSFYDLLGNLIILPSSSNSFSYQETDPIFNAISGTFVRNSQTSSFTLTESFNNFTSSYNSGSFTGSFNGNVQGTSSYALSASWAPQEQGITQAQILAINSLGILL
jgi:hypothetical protein